MVVQEFVLMNDDAFPAHLLRKQFRINVGVEHLVREPQLGQIVLELGHFVPERGQVQA